MEKTERFGLVLSVAEKEALRLLAEHERISAAAVVRRLVWMEAGRRGVLPADDNRPQESSLDG